MKIKLNQSGLKKATRQAGQHVAAEYQSRLDEVHRDYAGRSVEEVKPVLAAAWASVGGRLSDEELVRCAQAISDGQPVVMRVKDA